MITKGQIKNISQRILVIVSWAFWIGLIGYIGGSYINDFWKIIFMILGAILGGLWGTRSNWLIF